jgi:glucose-6-phosphate isomerase
MERADDFATRPPHVDLARRAAYLKSTFRFSSGHHFDRADIERAGRAADGLRRRDPATWSSAPEVQAKVANRLGWLAAPELMLQSIDRLTAFAGRVKAEGFSDIVLLGMGGSSLAPEVLRAIGGSAAGYPALHVLDSTDPAAVRAVRVALERTLFILASKSGTTIEPNSLAAYFRGQLESAGVRRWADHFIAITDEETELHQRARAKGFREIFINPSDIGGRYSALSFFGLVPAALMGQDVRSLIGWGLAMLDAFQEPEVLKNPALVPGLMMAAGARRGRDKLTLVQPVELEPFGLWVEQLVAESTGKSGVGVVPVVGERKEPRRLDASDRLFAMLSTSDPSLKSPAFLTEFPETAALGAEFVRWEIATAIAGALLEINPFDEPNVQQAKDATRVLLDRYRSEGKLPAAKPDATTPDGVILTLSQAAQTALANLENPANPANLVNPANPEAFLSLVRPGDYVAILAYVGPDPALLAAFQEFRTAVFERTGVATTFGYGPRYLHSTGQLHKGGPNNGVFIMVTATPADDLPIPGEAFSFGTLESAQALGDFASLDAAGRRALHVHLPVPTDATLQKALTPLLAMVS